MEVESFGEFVGFEAFVGGMLVERVLFVGGFAFSEVYVLALVTAAEPNIRSESLNRCILHQTHRTIPRRHVLTHNLTLHRRCRVKRPFLFLHRLLPLLKNLLELPMFTRLPNHTSFKQTAVSVMSHFKQVLFLLLVVWGDAEEE